MKVRRRPEGEFRRPDREAISGQGLDTPDERPHSEQALLHTALEPGTSFAIRTMRPVQRLIAERQSERKVEQAVPRVLKGMLRVAREGRHDLREGRADRRRQSEKPADLCGDDDDREGESRLVA
jgi:hypothetical protein